MRNLRTLNLISSDEITELFIAGLSHGARYFSMRFCHFPVRATGLRGGFTFLARLFVDSEIRASGFISELRHVFREIVAVACNLLDFLAGFTFD